MKPYLTIILIITLLTACAPQKVELEQESILLGGKTSPLYTFSQSSYEKALQEDKTILLFFYSSWSSASRNEQKQLIAAFSELNNSDVVGFRVHFKDQETSQPEEILARQNGVIRHNTKLLIENKEVTLKEEFLWDKDNYLKYLK